MIISLTGNLRNGLVSHPTTTVDYVSAATGVAYTVQAVSYYVISHRSLSIIYMFIIKLPPRRHATTLSIRTVHIPVTDLTFVLKQYNIGR